MHDRDNPALYIVKKRIRYHGDGIFHRKLVDPKDAIAQVGLPMDHIKPAALQLLIRKGYLAKKSSK